MNAPTTALRIVLTVVLLVFAYRETGPATVSLLALLALYIELHRIEE